VINKKELAEWNEILHEKKIKTKKIWGFVLCMFFGSCFWIFLVLAIVFGAIKKNDNLAIIFILLMVLSVAFFSFSQLFRVSQPKRENVYVFYK
jgi:hypothetical protein